MATGHAASAAAGTYKAVRPPEDAAVTVLPAEDEDEEDSRPPAVPAATWERLQRVRAARDAIAEAEARSGRRRRLAKNALRRVAAGASPEDLAAMGLAPAASAGQRRKLPDTDSAGAGADEAAVRELEALRPFMGLHGQLRPLPDTAAPSALSRRIDAALAAGEHRQALALGDELARAQAARELVGAVRARDYAARAADQARREQAKRPRLHWTFDSKQRWERKGNM